MPFIALFCAIAYQSTMMNYISGVRTEYEGDQQKDYPMINLFVGMYLQSFRNSLGDIAPPNYAFWQKDQTDLENYNYSIIVWIWVLFFLTEIVTMVIFLNFVIAKVGEAYNEGMAKQQVNMMNMKVDLNLETMVLLDYFTSQPE